MRQKLVVYFTELNKFIFNKAILLQHGPNEEIDSGIDNWQYPCACEADGNLVVIYTAGKVVDGCAARGAAVSIISLNIL